MSGARRISVRDVCIVPSVYAAAESTGFQPKGVLMNIKEIKEMITLMNENGLSEFELEKNGLKVRLKRGQSGHITQTVEDLARHSLPAENGPGGHGPKAPATPVSRAMEIKSPMVGTFYQAPSPDAPPYISVGDIVEPGQVVCIIEAMKLMNEIKSEIRGKVRAVLVENADPVEFGQVLFHIEPAT